MSDPSGNAEALQLAMEMLQGLLLALEPAQREAFRRRWMPHGGTADDVARARELLMRVLAAIRSGDPQRWTELSLAHAALAPQSAAPPGPAPPTVVMPEAKDFTLPAVTEFRLALDIDEEPDAAPPPASSHRVDATVALGELSSADLGLDEGVAPVPRPPATGTLQAGTTPTPAMDLEKYAVLCAWTQAHPERRADLHAQYGLADEAAREALDRDFEARFAENPSLRGAFANRLRLHLKFISAGRG